MEQGLLIAASMAAMAVACPAQAQNAAAEENGSDIVVTAQKRSQNLQDVPLSISIVSDMAF